MSPGTPDSSRSGGSVILSPVDLTKMTATPIDELAPFVDGDMEAVRVRIGDRDVHVIGRTRRDASKWSSIANGDVVLFSGRGAVRRKGTVVHTMKSSALSRAKWPPEEYGDHEVWDHIVLVAIDGEVEIPYARLNEASGDSPKYVPFGFRVMRAEQSARVLSLLEELTRSAH